MVAMVAGAVLAFSSLGGGAQSAQTRPAFNAFEVATIKPVEPTAKSGRYIVMQGTNRFVEKAYTLKLLIAAAYDLNPQTVVGGPEWMSSDHYDIQAVTPGEVRPTHAEQMAMLRTLLSERFQLTFHREQREFSIYVLEVGKDGAKLKASAAGPEEPAVVGPGMVYPEHMTLPGRNAGMGDLTSLLQRSILDRPVVDRTGLTGRYDFDLEWAPDETQFGGEVGSRTETSPKPPLFEAIQQEMGLRLRATRGEVATLVVDKVERPSAN